MYRISIAFLTFVFASITATAQEVTPKTDAQPKTATAAAAADESSPQPKQITGGVLNAKAISLPKPEYPPAARAVSASGEVKVRVLIDELGNVISAEATEGHPLLRAVSVEAARQAKFSPTKLSGEPVKVAGLISYNFVPPGPVIEKGVLAGIPKNERHLIWGLGFLFGIVQTADIEVIRLMGDEQEFFSMLKELSTDLGADAQQYKPVLEKLEHRDLAVRSAAARDFLKQVRKEFNAEQNWQIDAGEQIGFIASELLRQKVQYVKIGIAIDDSLIRTHLRKLSDLLLSIPADADGPTKEKFRRVAAYADAPALTTEAKMAELLDAISPLFEELDK